MNKILMIALFTVTSPLLAGSVKSSFEESFPNWTIVTNHPTPIVQADFDGNGLVDTVLLIQHKTDDIWQIAVFWQQPNQQWIVEPLPQHSPSTFIADVRIANQPVGLFKTICSHPQIPCKPNKKPQISLKNEGIRLTVLEASDSILYWDEHKKIFLRDWLSD